MKESGLLQLAVVVAVAIPGLTACAGEGDSAREGGAPAAALEHDGSREGEERGEGGEHAEGDEHRQDGEHREGGEGEESGEYIASGDSWDATRHGLRLRLSFDSASGAFAGTVENTTQETICAVRVEVHLSGSVELGPTEPTDLGSGESAAVELPAGQADFETWTAHPEQSSCPDQQPGPVSHTPLEV